MNPTLTGETGAFKFQGSLVPTSNELYSLGSTTSRWKDLNVSGSVNATSFVGDGSLLTGITSGGPSLWSQSSSNVYVTGSNVGINTPTPTNALHVVGNTRIEGNLTVNGTQTIVNTNVGTTEQLVITNDGTGPALVVNQTGAQPVLDVQDDGVSVLKIIDGGNVGVGTTNPQAKLHVNGFALHSNPYYSARKISYGTVLRVGILEYSNNDGTIQTNVLSWYISASGNGYFEPKLAGTYFVIATDIGAGTGVGGGTGTLDVRVNSTTYCSSHWNNSDAWENVTTQAIVRCNGTTDKIYIVAGGSGVWQNESHSRISIYYLGP